MNDTDTLILKEIKSIRSQDKGFSRLVATYKVRLYWQIRKIVLTHEDADDVLQNVFIKVFRHIRGFKSDSKLHTWLYRIAYNESINHLKKIKQELAYSLHDYEDYLIEKLESDQYFDGDEATLKLQKALLRLPARQREVFNYRYYDELKFHEIAEILKLSEGAVKSSYHHAQKKMQQWIVQE